MSAIRSEGDWYGLASCSVEAVVVEAAAAEQHSYSYAAYVELLQRWRGRRLRRYRQFHILVDERGNGRACLALVGADADAVVAHLHVVERDIQIASLAHEPTLVCAGNGADGHGAAPDGGNSVHLHRFIDAKINAVAFRARGGAHGLGEDQKDFGTFAELYLGGLRCSGGSSGGYYGLGGSGRKRRGAGALLAVRRYRDEQCRCQCQNQFLVEHVSTPVC